MPQVSVIIAARDAQDTLPETLASIAAQTFGDWEIVLVDDCSSDTTAQIARDFGPSLTVLRSERVLGPGGARNLGAMHASGDVLALLDADDMWRPQYLERQVAALEAATAEGQRVGAISSLASLCSAGGEELPRLSLDPKRLPARIGLTDVLRENPLHAIALIPKAVFDEVGGFADDLRHAEDYDLWLRIAERGYEMIVTREPLAIIRLRPAGLSAQSDRLAAGTAEAYSRALQRGRLTGAQRRLARRQRRLQRVIAARARVATAPHRSRIRERLQVRVMSALVAVEHPERWAHWLRHGVRTAGPGRHA